MAKTFGATSTTEEVLSGVNLKGKRILVTGASSPLAVGVLRQLLMNPELELWCGRHQKEIPLSASRLHVIDLDLERDMNEMSSFDMVVHFAGLTHTSNEQQYWNINHKGTVRLAETSRANGCRRFVYISTRCATRGSGAWCSTRAATTTSAPMPTRARSSSAPSSACTSSTLA